MNALLQPYINALTNGKIQALLKTEKLVQVHILRQEQPFQPFKKTYVPRGRKKNNVCKLENLDITKYVQATVTTINNEKYFMDQHNILFKFDTNEIVGHIVNHEVQWF